eukprot:1041482-Rhodomonas_salina.2
MAQRVHSSMAYVSTGHGYRTSAQTGRAIRYVSTGYRVGLGRGIGGHTMQTQDSHGRAGFSSLLYLQHAIVSAARYKPAGEREREGEEGEAGEEREQRERREREERERREREKRREEREEKRRERSERDRKSMFVCL